MNHWAALLGEVTPRDIAGLQIHRHTLSDAEPLTSPPMVPGRRGPPPKRRVINYWPLIGHAKTAEIRAAWTLAWALIVNDGPKTGA